MSPRFWLSTRDDAHARFRPQVTPPSTTPLSGPEECAPRRSMKVRPRGCSWGGGRGPRTGTFASAAGEKGRERAGPAWAPTSAPRCAPRPSPTSTWAATSPTNAAAPPIDVRHPCRDPVLDALLEETAGSKPHTWQSWSGSAGPQFRHVRAHPQEQQPDQRDHDGGRHGRPGQ